MIHSGNVLAFIGDGVLTLQVREYLVEKGITNTKYLQEKSVAFVSAKAQANFIQYLLDKKVLNDTEISMFKRGRNAKSHHNPKNTEMIDYRRSTGVEALVGYLYLKKDKERLDEIMQKVKDII